MLLNELLDAEYTLYAPFQYFPMVLKLLDLNFIKDKRDMHLEEVLNIPNTSYGYIDYIKSKLELVVVKHSKQEEAIVFDNVKYASFKGENSFFNIPWKTYQFINKEKPDVVLVQGTIFPFKVIILKWFLGKQSKIIVQHHAEQAFINPIKRRIQRFADRYIDAYLFTSIGNTVSYLNAGIFSDTSKCYEVLEASSFMKRQDATVSKKALGLIGDSNFLWVARLNPIKDPITVLKGFEQYCVKNSEAILHMIYQDITILEEVKAFIAASPVLTQQVKLIGTVLHEELATWYSAVDFFVSGSHWEGSGYAFIECLACGCIPVMTDIPPFKAITGNGTIGIMYECGNADALAEALDKTKGMDREEMRRKISDHFDKNLSFKKIADDIYKICCDVTGKA